MALTVHLSQGLRPSQRTFAAAHWQNEVSRGMARWARRCLQKYMHGTGALVVRSLAIHASLAVGISDNGAGAYPYVFAHLVSFQ